MKKIDEKYIRHNEKKKEREINRKDVKGKKPQ